MARNDSVGLDTVDVGVTDAERLDVYRVALEAHGAVVSLAIGEHRILRDQLERASLSVALS